jgi:hypothetical protein
LFRRCGKPGACLRIQSGCLASRLRFRSSDARHVDRWRMSVPSLVRSIQRACADVENADHGRWERRRRRSLRHVDIHDFAGGCTSPSRANACLSRSSPSSANGNLSTAPAGPQRTAETRERRRASGQSSTTAREGSYEAICGTDCVRVTAAAATRVEAGRRIPLLQLPPHKHPLTELHIFLLFHFDVVFQKLVHGNTGLKNQPSSIERTLVGQDWRQRSNRRQR